MLKVFCDGGARGNPGPAAYGFVVKENDKVIKEGSGYLGVATNNVAEYSAIIKALLWLKKDHHGSELQFFLDSQLAESQLNGVYKIKNVKIRELLVNIRELESEFKQISYQHIPREQNKEADRQVNLALDIKVGKKQNRWN